MKIWRELLGYVKLIVIVVAITLGINNVVLINAKIPSPSMEKTLMVKDRLLLTVQRRNWNMRWI